jgi:hypothetical protein
MAQGLLLFAPELTLQQFVILSHDPNQPIGVLGMVAYQLGQCFNLALESFNPPDNATQVGLLPIFFRARRASGFYARGFLRCSICHGCSLLLLWR